jgi:glycosyltransferase involved in cell wall biosynthesis
MLDSLVTRSALPVNAKAEIVLPRELGGRRPSVSVVIPCYNYGSYLTQCVNSVLDQPGVRVDILIIDDASTDGSDQVVRRLGAQDKRIRTIIHAENQGNVATYNEGLTHVTGDYTVLISADDLLTPGCLARATALMEEYPSVGFAYGSPVIFRDSELPPARTTAKRWIIWPGRNWIWQRCKNGENALRSPEGVMRTSVLREIGGVFQAHLPHACDFEMWLRHATAADVGYIAGADQAYYRIHATNMHHKMDAIGDYAQRLGSFDTVFSERAGMLKEVDAMRDEAHRTIARLALRQAERDTAYRTIARSAYHPVLGKYLSGPIGDSTVDDYRAFALKAWPDAKNLSEWQTLNRLCKDDGLPQLNPSLLAHMAMRKLRSHAVLWRRNWVGA